MSSAIGTVSVLLAVAAVVAMVARRLRLPYTVGLVLAGIVLAFLPRFPELSLTKELIFSIFLPPLVYEAALYIRWRDLVRDLPLTLSMATLGVLLSAAITAWGMHTLAHWAWPAAIMLGTLIAATDPVSVIAAFKEAAVHGRLRLLVESESLFNDGTTAVLFSTALSTVIGQSTDASEIVQRLLSTVGIGIISGLLVGSGTLLLAGRTEDHLVEITLTVAAAFGSFLLAERFQGSGVLASLTAGLLTGNLGPLGSFSARGRESVESFWEFITFMVNSLIFILIGIREAHQDLIHSLAPIALASLLVILGWAVTVYPICGLFTHSPLQVKPEHQHVLFWGGLRGTLALALALGLPAEIADREIIITVAFGVVAFSIFIQGLTVLPLIQKVSGPPEAIRPGEPGE